MTREEKAIEIAKLEGWELLHCNVILERDLFSSFNGLMEIVFRSKSFKIDTVKGIIEVKDDYASYKLFLYNQLNEIDVLQDAILFYLREVQNEKQN